MIGRRCVLLGPQRLEPTLESAFVDSPRGAPIALVSAGWEEREPEDQELRDHVERPVINLRLFERTEEVFREDPELFEAMRRRHDRLRRLQELHRIRLSHAMEAARELMRQRYRESVSSLDLLDREIEEAIQIIRAVDSHQAERIGEIHAEFEAEVRPAERESVTRRREEIEREMSEACAVCVAGGHVAILLNRLRLYGFPSLVGDRLLVCWSAGAMALSPQVVVFHDSPPQGRGDAEVLEQGLGMFPGVVALPHARRRLRLEDPTRVGLFARRFRPNLCAALDEGARLDWDGSRWTGAGRARRLTAEGMLEEIGGRG